MRSPGSIYRKLKEVRYRHLISMYRKYLRRSPENCLYNCQYAFVDSDGKERELRLCLYNQEQTTLEGGVDPSLIDVCDQLRHCQNCNAFVLKCTREDVKKILEEELNNEKLKAKKYPDISALEWVLERHSNNINHLGIIGIIWYHIKRILSSKS